MVVELPFNDAEDAAQGGDAPYELGGQRRPMTLRDYWTTSIRTDRR